MGSTTIPQTETGANDPICAESIFTVRESNTIKRALKYIEEGALSTGEWLLFDFVLGDYLRLRFAGLRHEEAHVLYLDLSDRLLAAEKEAEGNHKSVQIPIRRIAHRALTLGADKVVLAHNHPNESSTPSDADVEALTFKERALAPLGVAVRDSYVVTSTEITSVAAFRAKLEEEEWERRRNREQKAREERSRKYRETRARNAAKKAAEEAARESC